MTHIGREIPRLKDANVGGTLTSTNPAEQRRLVGLLNQLDREKKKRLGTLEWNQRNFFIKQVFDHNNDLRFVKASERPKYLDEISLPSLHDDVVGVNNITDAAPREHINSSGVDPPPSSPIADVVKTVCDEDESFDGVTGGHVELNKTKNDPTKEDGGNCEVDSASERPVSQWKLKLPILKVRAMGLFARASSAESSSPVKQSSEVTHLPPQTHETARRRNLSGDHHDNSTMTSRLLPPAQCEATPSPPTNRRHQSIATQALLSPAIYRRHVSARRSVDVNDLRMLKGQRSREDFLSSPSTIRRQRSNSKPAVSSRGNNVDQWNRLFERRNGSLSYSGRSGHFTMSNESITDLSDGDCDEKLLRKLVRSLPTQLLLRARERETETGSKSAGVEEMKRKLLERCRSESNQRTVEDPRFKSLANSLTEVNKDTLINSDQILD